MFSFKPEWYNVQLEILDDSLLIFFTTKDQKSTYEIRRLLIDQPKSRIDDFGGESRNKTAEVMIYNTKSNATFNISFLMTEPKHRAELYPLEKEFYFN